MRKLTSFGGAIVSGGLWSPDGGKICFTAYVKGVNESYGIRPERGKPERLGGMASGASVTSWSRDGKWLYIETEPSGKAPLWKIPVGGGEAVRVTRQGGSGGVESWDGQFVYYRREGERDTSELWEVPSGGGEERRIVRSLEPYATFTAGKRGVYFLPDRRKSVVRLFDFANRKVMPAVTLDKLSDREAVSGLGLSPDEKWLLYSTIIGPNANVLMVENYRP